ncbi:MAG TPA: hypothetical protein VGL95_02480 [Acetobacteraceae bacterium]|jgi:hypothetical protein
MALGLLTKHAAKSSRVAKARQAQEHLYQIANLFPEDTGLPVTVWVSPRGRARHAAAIKVCRGLGNRMVPSNAAVVAIEQEPGLVAGRLQAEYLRPVMHWVAFNHDALLPYGNGEIGTGALIHRLQRASA